MSPDTRPVYASLAALSDRYAGHGAPAGRPAAPDLAPHELRVFSQNGEDGVIEEILRRIGGGGTFVGVGGGRPCRTCDRARSSGRRTSTRCYASTRRRPSPTSSRSTWTASTTGSGGRSMRTRGLS